MKNWMKRALTLVLCFCLVAGMLPAWALAAQTEESDYYELNDGYLSVKVSKANGGFLVDTVEGDKLNKSDNNKYLLYPDAAYDTSYTSFRVTRGGETKDYIFGRNYSFLGLGENDLTVTQSGENMICATWRVDGLEFTQNLALMEAENNQHGMVYITYSVKNLSGEAVDQIQARVMMDTALGYQDYAVYMGAQRDGTYTTIRTERTMTGSDYTNYFFAYDDEYAPSVTAYVLNATVGGTTIVPEKVTFAHWNNLASTVFDYTPEADPAKSLNFTNPYNEAYLTADSAVAMYYNMGAVPAGAESEQAVALYYGVYSNVNAQEGRVALNFAGTTDMMLTEDKKGYRDLNGDAYGNFTLTTKVQNASDEVIESLAVAFYTPEGIVLFDSNGNQNVTSTAADPFFMMLKDLKPGETRDITLNFLAEPSDVSDYRRINVRVFDLSDQKDVAQVQLLEEAVLGSRENYILCPSVDGGMLSFIGTTPNAIYTSGTRHLYLAGKNFGLLRDTSQYRVVLRPADGSADVVLPSSHVLINTADNTADLVLDQTMNPGTWQVIIDWNDTGKVDTTGEALRFVVSDKPAYRNSAYGIVAVWLSGDGTAASPWHYNLDLFQNEAAYERTLGGVSLDQILLVFRGSFDVKYDESGNVLSAEAVSLKDGEVISINECLDVSDGKVCITVRRDDAGKQLSIDTDIDGLVTTTGANTKVWDGVCAITSLEEGSLVKFPVYKYDGSMSHYVEDQTANTNMLMLVWPGAASTAQTLAGMVMELRYAHFGIMATEPGGTPNKHVVSFAAELSPDFLVPAANIPDQMDTDPIDVAQLNLAKSNYTPDQLRQVQETYRADLERWKEVETGSLELRITDILFGGGFIGFNTSLSVGVPSYADGLPSIEGTLNLKVINDEWAIGLEGSADMMVFSMEAELALRSYNGIPVPDKIRFFVGGTFPGIPVDPFGVFWIRGAGAGIDKMYETFFVASKIPPLTLILSGEFAIFNALSARADVGLSARGISAALSNISVAEIKVMDYLGGSVYWYPRLDVNLGMSMSILDIINGSGTIVLQQVPEEGLFWEAFARASINVPEYVLLIGGKELGSVELGLDAERIFGVVSLLKLQAGVTYYWGGDVEFAVGKYDVPEPVLAHSLNAVPVYTDPETGRTLYMSVMTNARLLAASNQPVAVTETEILTSVDGLSHSFTLDSTADEDALLYVTFPAENRAVAEARKKMFAITCGGEAYDLVWLDDNKAMDDPANADANAIFSYDEDSKEACITVSVTESACFDKEIKVMTPEISQLTLYGLTRLADLEEITVSGTTATITGSKLNEISKLTVYAVDESGNAWTLADVDTAEAGSSLDVELEFPANLPSGSYAIKAVGIVKDETDTPVSNPIVEVPFTYTNPIQPGDPAATASLGGDYTIDVTASASGDFDGYCLTVYEQTAQGMEATAFCQQTFPADQNVLTVGGQYTVPVADTVDENGNVLTYKTQTLGLEAGKRYVVGVSTYKELPDGTMIFSKEIRTEALTMVEAEEITLAMGVSGGKALSAGYGDVTMDYAAGSDVTVTVSGVDTVKNGSYQLDGGEAMAWSGGSIQLHDLADGVYTLTVTGENAAGDSFGTKYQFGVDTAAPRLLLSSPQGGGFFNGRSLTVTGISEAGATVTARVDDRTATATAGADGSFTLEVPMDPGMAYQKVKLTAADALGNSSEPATVTMTNSLIGDPDAVAVILVNGVEAKSVSCGTGDIQLELALKVNGKLIRLNSDSMTAGLVEFQAVAYQGEASVTDEGVLNTSADAKGIVRGTLEGYDVVIRLGDCDHVDTDGDGKCDICGELLGVIRVAGANRWATALLVADEMKAALGDEKFDAIIIASGNDFADALAGSYLATVKNAPILLSYGGDNEKYAYLDNDNIEYVKENLAEDGVVYILGGEKAVPTLYEDGLEGYDVVRLGGANRFETNILILEEAGIADGAEVLVCTSANFADSLSASATGKPILLVWNDRGVLYGSQPEFLEELKEKGCTFTILGGENAVSAKLADEVAKYGEVDRLAGNTRMETSVLVAEKYFDAPETAVLAYAWNYPDGLCGGSLAYALKAPLILTMPKYEQAAVDYAAENDITVGYVLGGDGLIGDAEVRAIFAMAAADQIVVKN